MKTFKQYFTEAAEKPIDNWDDIVKYNPELKSGIRLVKAIEKLGGEALIVGGSVRDIILGKEIKDVDIATNVPIERIKENFKTNDIGGSGDFGITMVHYGGYTYEVAHYREEEGTSDNRRPDKVTMVKSFEGDSARRDLTINSMGLNSKGEIVDYQGGLEDLKNGIIRTVGKAGDRFTEDALRIIRTARFASKYGFKIEPETKLAMKELSHLVDNISAERISGELIKVASNGKQLADYIEHLDDVGLLETILPEVKEMQGKKQNPKHHPEGDAYEHTLSALRHTRSDNPTTNLAILLHDVGKGMVAAGEKDGHPTYHAHDRVSSELVIDIAHRLKFSKDMRTAIEFAASNHMKTHYINDMSNRKVTNLVNSPYWEILKDVVYADELSRGDIGKGGIEAFDTKMTNAENIASEISQGGGQNELDKFIKSKIDGRKVMLWTGLSSGKELGDIIKQTKEWLYDNQDATDDDIRNFVLNTYKDSKEESLEECYQQILEGREYPPAVLRILNKSKTPELNKLQTKEMLCIRQKDDLYDISYILHPRTNEWVKPSSTFYKNPNNWIRYQSLGDEEYGTKDLNQEEYEEFMVLEVY